MEMLWLPPTLLKSTTSCTHTKTVYTKIIFNKFSSWLTADLQLSLHYNQTHMHARHDSALTVKHICCLVVDREVWPLSVIGRVLSCWCSSFLQMSKRIQSSLQHLLKLNYHTFSDKHASRKENQQNFLLHWSALQAMDQEQIDDFWI